MLARGGDPPEPPVSRGLGEALLARGGDPPLRLSGGLPPEPPAPASRRLGEALLARGGDPPKPPASRRLGEDTPPARLPSPTMICMVRGAMIATA